MPRPWCTVGYDGVNAGYAVTIAIIALGLVLGAYPIRRPGSAGILSWLLSAVPNESPFLAFAYLLVSSAPLIFDRPSLPSLVCLGVGVASFVTTPVLIRRALAARDVLTTALEPVAHPGRAIRWRSRLPWFRIIAAPLPFFARGVRVERAFRYGPHRRHRLDVYSPRRRTDDRPLLIHLHGGGFRSGRRSLYSRPLLHAFARNGWVCISPSYRLRPASYTDMLEDVHAVIRWARAEASRLGVDPTRIVLAGSSAGAHLAVTAALAPRAGTQVSAAIGLYGYYGRADSSPDSSPAAHVHADAPPVMIVHGDQDTLVPPGLQTALVESLRTQSVSPVVYAELPGAQHTFDLVHSVRFELVIDAVAAFATAITDGPAPTTSARDGDHVEEPTFGAG